MIFGLTSNGRCAWKSRWCRSPWHVLGRVIENNKTWLLLPEITHAWSQFVQERNVICATYLRWVSRCILMFLLRLINRDNRIFEKIFSDNEQKLCNFYILKSIKGMVIVHLKYRLLLEIFRDFTSYAILIVIGLWESCWIYFWHKPYYYRRMRDLDICISCGQICRNLHDSPLLCVVFDESMHGHYTEVSLMNFECLAR